MKVLHFDTGRDWRGGQAQVLLLLQGLRARGVSSWLAAPPAPLLERAAALGFETREWRARGDLDVMAVVRATSLVRAIRPDVVHLHSARAHALGVSAARIGRAKVVVVSRRVALVPRRGAASRLKYATGVDRYLCVSRAARDALLEVGVPAARTVVVPSGVPVAALRRQAEAGRVDLSAMLGIDATSPILGTVASLTTEKHHRLLLRAATLLGPVAHWVWVGEGPERAALERDREERGLVDRVHLLGRRDDVADLLRQFTLAVVGSRHEGFCTAAAEALALGVPVVATAVGGIPEVVEDGVTGVLVPDDDADAMAAAIARLLADGAERERMSRSGAAAASRFDADATARRTLEVYVDLLGRGVL